MKLDYLFDFVSDYEYEVNEDEVIRLFGAAPDYDEEDYGEWIEYVKEYYEEDARAEYERGNQNAKESEKELKADYQKSVL